VFTPDERTSLREGLLAAARADTRITGAAITGSAAVDREDRWSDIDLALCVDSDLDAVVADWTARMYHEHGAVDHLDVWHNNVRFRVFLLASTLQVDLAFWPGEFGPTSPTFRLIFGSARDQPPRPAPNPSELVGLGWLYALHVRSSLARGRPWQAEHMLTHLRDHILSLACLRHGLPAVHGRGIDDLPPAVTTSFAATLVRELTPAELARAFEAATQALLAEAQDVNPTLADRLTAPLLQLSRSPDQT
jgi:hypothetical protein